MLGRPVNHSIDGELAGPPLAETPFANRTIFFGTMAPKERPLRFAMVGDRSNQFISSAGV